MGEHGRWSFLRRLVCCGLLTVPALAFDIEAHDAIGQTAASAMDHQAVKGMKRLLGGQDASDVAGWGHQADDTYPGLSQLHFQVHDDSSQPFCGPAEGRVAKCDDNICLLTAIKHFYGKVLADEGRKTDFPSIDFSKVHTALKFTDADSVKMLINLLGDLHQPLHVGFASDNNGRNIQVRFRGQTVSLYDFWDTTISQTVQKYESGFWYGGWTHVRGIQKEFAADKEKWKKDGPAKCFEDWLAESVQFACDKVYTHPMTGKKLAEHAAQGVVDIDNDAYVAWKRDWLRQILLAGERIAIVMNDILDAGGAAKLHQGTGVKTHADEEKAKQEAEWASERDKMQKAERASRTATNPFRIDFRIAALNFGIACITVPVFLVIANYGLDPRTWAAFVKSLLEESSNKNGGGAPSAAAGRNLKRYE